MAALRVGVGSIDITPPHGLDISGNLWARQSLGTKDPLMAKALVLDDGTTKAAVVALDLIALERMEVVRARELIQHRTGIPADHVVVSCSHTHQGPSSRRQSSACVWPEAYMEALPRRIADAVDTAVAGLAPSEWAYAVGEEGGEVGHYRRIRLANGRVRNSWLVTPQDEVVGPVGEMDTRIPMLAFRVPGDGLRALLWNFACHANCPGDGRWSANYPAYTAAALKESLGVDPAGVLYTVGASANTNPKVLDSADFGAKVAAHIPPALEGAAWRGEARIATKEQLVTMPARHQDHFPYDLIKEAYGPKYSQADFARVVRYYANEYQRLVARGPEPVETAVQVLAVDDTALVTIPGELFVELGRQIQARSPFRNTVVVTLANDWLGYFPNREAFGDGGYETIFAAQSRMAPEAGDLIVEAAVGLLQEVGRGAAVTA